jgi:hypothetical protein
LLITQQSLKLEKKIPHIWNPSNFRNVFDVGLAKFENNPMEQHTLDTSAGKQLSYAATYF